MFSLVLGSIVGSVKGFMKFGFVIAFLGVLVAFGIWFVGFISNIYGVITGYVDSIVSESVPSELGYVLGALGIDQFVSSAFAILFSAGALWITAIGSISVFKLSRSAYHILIEGLS